MCYFHVQYQSERNDYQNRIKGQKEIRKKLQWELAKENIKDVEEEIINRGR